MQTKEYNLYTVIITYNGSKWVEKCLGSLNNSSIRPKTIVIDNGSKDQTLSIIKSEFPEVEIIETGKNLGFGQANNIGIKKAYDAGADYVFLLNQDAWVEEDTIEKLINAHFKEPTFGIVSPMHLSGKGDQLDFLFSTYIEPRRCKNLYSDIYLQQVKEKIYEVPFVNAAAWLMSRNCIEIVGGFNPSFFHYAEDDNYLDRLIFHGLKVGIYPHCKIYHDRSEREQNLVFHNPDTTYKRNIIKEMSNPNESKTFQNLIASYFKDFFISLLRFRFKEIFTLKYKLTIVYGLNKSEIIKNRALSRKKGLTFLDEISKNNNE